MSSLGNFKIVCDKITGKSSLVNTGYIFSGSIEDVRIIPEYKIYPRIFLVYNEMNATVCIEASCKRYRSSESGTILIRSFCDLLEIPEDRQIEICHSLNNCIVISLYITQLASECMGRLASISELEELYIMRPHWADRAQEYNCPNSCVWTEIQRAWFSSHHLVRAYFDQNEEEK